MTIQVHSMKNILLTSMTFAAVMLTAPAYAQHAERGPDVHDEQSQAVAPADSSIADYDTDHDGNISLMEYLAGDSSNTERVYQHLDANHDGMLDQQEQEEVKAIYQLMRQPSQVKAKSI